MNNPRMAGCFRNIAVGRRAFIVAAVSLGLFGCGKESGRLPLSGSVSWQGRPLVKGSILFVPTADHRGPKTGAPIVNGEYQISEERGATPGTYRVEVRGDTGEYPHAPTDRPAPKARTPAVVIAAEYNSQSILTVVVSPEETSFNFDLPLRNP